MFGSMIDSAIGPLMQGIAQSQAYGYQSHVAGINAAIATRGAQTAVQEGQTAESASRMRTGYAVANAEAGQAASGVDTTGGSAPKVRSAIQSLGDLDARTIRYNAAQKAYGLSTESLGYREQSQMASAASKNALVGGVMNAYSSFVGSSSSSLNNFYQLQQVGALAGV